MLIRLFLALEMQQPKLAVCNEIFFVLPSMISDRSISVGKDIVVTHKKQVPHYHCSLATVIQFLYYQVSYDLE